MGTENGKHIKPGLWNKNFLLAMLVSAMASLAHGMFNPALPIYAEGYGIGSDLIGVIVAVATGLSMFGRAVIGWLSDRKSKKLLVLCSLVIMAVSYVLYLFPVSLPLISIARIFQGVGNGMLITVLSTLALENLPPERFGEGIGIYSLSSALAQCVSPLLGTDLAKLGMFRLIFISSLVSTLVAIIILAFIQNAPSAPQIIIENKEKRTGFHISDFIYRDAILGAVMLLFMGIVHSAISNYLAIYGLKQGLEQIGLFFTINSLVLLLSRPLLGKLADKVHPTWLIVPGYLMMAIAFLLLFCLDSMVTVCFCGVFYGVGFGAVQSTSQMISVKSAPPEKRGVANSTFYVLGDIGLALGAFLAGYLATLLGYGMMFLIMGGVSVLAIVVFLAGANTPRMRRMLKNGLQ